jgi:drug/metabolite transporter (DMT)-like permease
LANSNPRAPARGRSFAIAAWLLFLLAETATQVVFKIAGASLELDGGLQHMIFRAAASPWVWAGFGLYLVDFILWLTILNESDLGRAYPLTSLVYLTTLLAAVTLFQEHLNLVRILGAATIMAGVAILLNDDKSPGHGQPPHSGQGAAPHWASPEP